RGESSIEALNAVLKEEPPPLSESGRPVPASLERIAHRCLDKNPDARWQTATDLAFALEALSISSPVAAPPSGAQPVAVPAPLRNRRLPIGLTAGVAVIAAIVAAFLAGRTSSQPTLLSFHRITFGRGTVMSARFAPDGAS